MAEKNLEEKCTKCDFTGDTDQVVLHYMRKELYAKEILYMCAECGWATHVRGRMWQHKRDEHSAPSSENIENTCTGTFRDMCLTNIIRD